jgi:hypothetical protein
MRYGLPVLLEKCPKRSEKRGHKGPPIFRTLVASLIAELLEAQNEEGTATEGFHRRPLTVVRFRGLFCLDRRAERVIPLFIPSIAIMREQSSG